MINKRGLAVSQVFLMILGMVSFAFMVGIGSSAQDDEVSLALTEEAIERLQAVVIEPLPSSPAAATLPVPGTVLDIVPLATGTSATGTSATGTSATGTSANSSNYPLFFKTDVGPLVGHLAEGFVWAVGAAAFVSLVGQLANIGGKDNIDVNAATVSVAGGILAGKLTYGVLQGIDGGFWKGSKATPGNWWGSKGVATGVGVAIAWYLYTSQYEKETVKLESVSFQCMSWQAPRGGEDCDLCNKGPVPCSEYRCKSLGQGCEIENKGTAFEMCVYKGTREVNPPVIKPWDDKLTAGYAYTDVKLSPPGPGFKIKKTDSVDSCIPAFTPIEFGVITDKPAQCKIDVEYKDSFDSMATFMGGDNIYKYNHSEFLTLPKAKDIKNSSINLEMGNEMTLYLRCRDSWGNLNQAPYAVRFCVDSAPDATAPQIKATSIETESCVAADRNSTQVSFYTDEPAQCKWGFENQAYDSLPYNMSCTTQVYQVNSMMLYTCNTELTGVKREGTDYYVKCEDRQNEPKNLRNSMAQPVVFRLKGSNPLKLKTVLPNGTIYGGVSPMRVDLRAETLFGCDDNRAVCFYSSSGLESSYVAFFDTDQTSGIHIQRLDLFAGTHTYFVKCVDAGGNVAISNTTFTLDIDTASPIVTRAYYEDDYLKLVTVRDSDCVYSADSCDFLFEEGILMPYAKSSTHIVAWENDKIFYVKCRDEFRNEPIDCSVVIQPKENFLNY